MTPDEAVAVGREELDRLRFKAANLLRRGMPVMAAQETRAADMLEVLLAERERLREALDSAAIALNNQARPSSSWFLGQYRVEEAEYAAAHARDALAGKARP